MDPKTHNSRRKFLAQALGAAGAFGLGALGGPRIVHAGSGAGIDREMSFVFCYFSGGWDVLLSLDTRDPALFNDSNASVTQIQPSFGTLQNVPPISGVIETNTDITFGPCVGELAGQADRICVVNGLVMDTLSHPVALKRFLTGRPPNGVLAQGSAVATWFASLNGEATRIPNLSVRLESYNADQPTYATALSVASLPDLVRSLQPGDPVPVPSLDGLLDQALTDLAKRDAHRSPVIVEAEAARQKARELVNSGQDALFDTTNQTPYAQEIRSHFHLDGADADGPDAFAALAAIAITNEVCKCVTIPTSQDLDTHFSNWAVLQGARQIEGFSAVARLIDYLRKAQYRDTSDSWLDHTIVIGFSDFARTPLLNQYGGRDHGLMNSCFLAGGPIKGGTVVGRTSDSGMLPLPVDLATGLPNPDGTLMRPDHVLQALFTGLGHLDDPAHLQVSPLSAILT